MQPGRASNAPPEFPDSWLGLWKDPYGITLYVERMHGRSLVVTLTPGIGQPCYPLEGTRDGNTHQLPAVYKPDYNGVPFLRVELGSQGPNESLDFRFLFGEGDRLRPAEPWDIVSGVMARPKLDIGGPAVEGEESTQLGWVEALGNFWKMDEEKEKYLSALATI